MRLWASRASVGFSKNMEHPQFMYLVLDGQNNLPGICFTHIFPEQKLWLRMAILKMSTSLSIEDKTKYSDLMRIECMSSEESDEESD